MQFQIFYRSMLNPLLQCTRQAGGELCTFKWLFTHTHAYKIDHCSACISCVFVVLVICNLPTQPHDLEHNLLPFNVLYEMSDSHECWCFWTVALIWGQKDHFLTNYCLKSLPPGQDVSGHLLAEGWPLKGSFRGHCDRYHHSTCGQPTANLVDFRGVTCFLRTNWKINTSDRARILFAGSGGLENVAWIWISISLRSSPLRLCKSRPYTRRGATRRIKQIHLPTITGWNIWPEHRMGPGSADQLHPWMRLANLP